MTTHRLPHCFFTLGTILLVGLSLGATPAFAVITAPTPTTTYTDAGDGLWKTGANWDVQVPTGTDNAKINDNQTAYYDYNADGNPDTAFFGTLTLGANSAFRLKTGNSRGLPTNSNVYFGDGSTLEYTAGSSNRNFNFMVLPGAAGSWETASNTFFRGTLQGAGDFTVEMSGNVESRIELDSLNRLGSGTQFTGHLTYVSDGGSTRGVTRMGRYGATGPRSSVGPGGATFGDHVYLQQERGDRMDDSATIVMSGAGQSGYKYSNSNNETISNLIIESPNQSGPYLLTGNGTNASAVRVTDTATFQGTAGTVEIQSKMSGYHSGKPRTSKSNINADNLVFQGTGDWTIDGSLVTSGTPTDFAPGSIGVANGGDVTTTANATINSPFAAPNGFTKKGNGTLTLNYYDTHGTPYGQTNLNPAGTVTVEAGTLEIGGNASLNDTTAINVGPGGTLAYSSSTALTVAPTFNGAGTSSRAVISGTGDIGVGLTLDNVGDTLSPGSSPGVMPFITGQTWSSYSYDWEVNNWDGDVTGTGVAGTDFDQITIAGALDLSGTAPGSYVLNVLSLDGSDMTGDVSNFAETDQSWTILTTTGGITGFDTSEWVVDPSGFTNLYNGAWSIELANGDNDLVLNYGLNVPEPSTIILAGLGLVGLLGRRRHRA